MVRLSKKGLVLVIALIAVLVGATGYLFWSVNDSDTPIAPEDIEAAPPEDKSSCGGCAAKNVEWYWSKKDGACKKKLNKAACGDDKRVSQECNDSSAESCKTGHPGSACRGTGKCVNTSGTGTSVKCTCQGGKEETVVPETNSCQGGALSTPAAGDTGKVGTPVTISGYAFDADGINKSTINVSIDGVVVGQATATDACPSGNTSVCTSVGVAKKPVVWTYTYTPTKESHDVKVAWADSKGASGASCTKTTTLTSSPKEVTSANWSLSSSIAGISCQNTDGTNVSGVVNYTITVTNVGDGEGTLSRVEVLLDDAVEDSFIMTESLVPAATVSGNVLTWDLTGSAATFAVDQSKTYKFSLDIPKTSYGVFSHEVTVVPSGTGVENVEQTLTGTIACTEDGQVPETGIFDSAIGQILMSMTLISLGYLYLKGYDKGVLNVLGAGARRVSDSYIGVFGEDARVARSRRNFEKKMK